MESTIKNQNYFEGLIKGVVTMYKLSEYLSNDLNLTWKIKFIDNKKADITCEYSSYVRDVLTNPGDEDFAPEYESINIRDTMVTRISDIEDVNQVINQIVTEILVELPNI